MFIVDRISFVSSVRDDLPSESALLEEKKQLHSYLKDYERCFSILGSRGVICADCRLPAGNLPALTDGL
jgi:hypothetical protein